MISVHLCTSLWEKFLQEMLGIQSLPVPQIVVPKPPGSDRIWFTLLKKHLPPHLSSLCLVLEKIDPAPPLLG